MFQEQKMAKFKDKEHNGTKYLLLKSKSNHTHMNCSKKATHMTHTDDVTETFIGGR